MSATPPTPDSSDAAGPDAVTERRRRRAAQAEQRKLADRLVGDIRTVRGFSDGQRRALIGVLIGFIVCIAIGLWRNPTFVADPLPSDAPLADQLADRVDPNDADLATLSALPQVGESRAKAIIEYRDRLRQSDANRVAFKSIDDLMRVRGIGYSISRLMEPYLMFPTTQPTTRVATQPTTRATSLPASPSGRGPG